MKKRKKEPPITFWFILGFLLVFSLGLGFLSSSKPTTSTKTRAATISGNTITVSGTNIKAIQNAIESAKDGDIINIPTGSYVSSLPIVTDPDYKYQTCLLHTRGKSITLRGTGNVVIDNQNGGLSDETQKTWSTGICVLGGSVIIDNISVKQTLRPGMVVWDAQAIIKNFKTIDIDNAAIDVNNSNVIIVNSVFWPGIGVGGNTQAIIENNTFFGGITFNLCKTSEPTIEFSNNVIVRGGISVSCPESQKITKIKSKNNFVYHGSPKGDQSCVGPGNTEGETCGTNELCEGTTFVWPGFVGADENGTICAWGEGWMQGDINTKTGSPATVAGAGVSTGPCVSGTSAACENYIKSRAFAALPTPTQEHIPPTDTSIKEQTEDPSLPDQRVSPPPIHPSSSRPPSDLPIGDQRSTSLFIIENMGFGTLTIQGIQLKNNYVPLNKKVETGEAIEYPLSNTCNNADETLQGSVLYADEKGKLSFPSLTIYCNKNNVFDIQ